MKIVVRNFVTRQYAAGGGAWTPKLEHALDFEVLSRASEFCRANPNFEVVTTPRPKIYLRKREGGLCLQTLGSWTPDPAKAYTFKTVAAAKQFCNYHEIAGVMIVDESSRESSESPAPAKSAKRARG